MKLTNAPLFSGSAQKVFQTVCGCEIKCQEPRVLSSGSPTSDVTGIITYGGELVGVMVLSFPEDVARKVVKSFAGAMSSDDIRSPQFLDAIGELANMVAGQAKARFEGYNAMISIPTVVCGPSHHVNRQTRAPWVVIVCESTFGKFVVGVSLMEKAK